MDYSKVGLDPQLNSLNRRKQNKFVSGNEFDATMDYGIITATRIGTAVIGSAQIQDAAIGNAHLGTAIIGTANIGTLSFNEITGGTATLGGTLNGNGVLTVKDSGGTSRVLLDSSGITVTGGSITVENDSGGTIVDSAGIVSTVNFDSAQVTSNTERTTTGTDMADYTGGALSEVTFTRSVRLMMFLFCYGRNDDFNTGANATEVQIYDTFTGDSTGINVWLTGEWFTEVDWDTGTGLINSTTERVSAQTESNWGIVTAAAGAHIYKARWRVSTGGTGRMYNIRLGYVVLGD